MHGLINVKSPNNTSKWQIGFNSAFKDLILYHFLCTSGARICKLTFEVVQMGCNFAFNVGDF
jgi:hypothetical protein